MRLTDLFRKKTPYVQAEARIDGLDPYPFRVHPLGSDEFISRSIVKNGTWEPLETEIARRILRHYSLFVDLGANIGWYTALAQRVMKPGSEIYAFEPDRRNFDLLQANAPQTDEVTTRLLRMAASDTAGSARLFHSKTNLGDHRLYAAEPDRRSIPVSMTTLDAYFGNRQLPPLFAKLDTQGSEPKIFRGASRVFSPQARDNAILLEFWPTAITGFDESVDDFVAALSKFEQQAFILLYDKHALLSVTWEEVLRRAKTDLTTVPLYFLDILMVTLGTPAHAAIADLVRAS